MLDVKGTIRLMLILHGMRTIKFIHTRYAIVRYLSIDSDCGRGEIGSDKLRSKLLD